MHTQVVNKTPTTRAETYASNLADAMEAADVSRKALVVALGELGCPVTEQAVGKWMRGECAPATRHQAAIAKTLRMPAHLLFPISMEMAA